MAQPGEATEWYSTSVLKQTVTVQRRASTQGQARESTKRQKDRKLGRSRGTERERKRKRERSQLENLSPVTLHPRT